MTVQDDSLYKKESSNMTQLLACAEITKNSCVIELSARDRACFLHSLARKINLLIFLPGAFYTSDQLHSEASFSGKTIETCPSEDNTDAS